MSILLRKILTPYQAPADDGSDLGGGAVDRGDDWTPTGDDAVDTATETEVKKPAAKTAAEAPSPEDKDLDPEDPDAGENDPPAEERKQPKKDSRIPLARHKEILDRERAERERLEQRLAQFEQGKQVAKLNDQLDAAETRLVETESAYNKALANGEIDKATQLMRDIRTQERAIAEAKADQRLQVATAQAVETARYDLTLERIEEAFPVLNQDHDDFDKTAMLEVVEWKAFYQDRRNMTPAKALQAAVKKVLGEPENRRQEQAVETSARVDKEEAAAAAQKTVSAERKKAAVARNVETAKKTPPSADKVGLDSDKLGGTLSAKDVMKMSQDEFKNLPDDVLARMRGDVI